MDEAFESQLIVTQKKRAGYAALRDLPAETRDGERVELMVNAGLRDDVAALDVTGADGIGLFRTEFQFLVSATLPQRERQQRLYKDVLDAAGNKPVIFRTVDVGGDKTLPYLREVDADPEENPAMGWRAVRLSLERDGLMKAQARALLEAAAGRTLYVMFPMISEPWELDAAQALFEKQRQWLIQRRKKLPNAVHFGAMLEVPALAEVLDIVLPKVNFISIGTNDLTQFLFAADRAHPKLAERYDWLSIAIMRFLARVIAQCEAAKVPVGVCGEMGGRTLEALALLGLGVRRLSITPASVGPVKAMIRAVDTRALAPFMADLLASQTPNVREPLLKWALENGVDLD
jgi:phosphotransferase system enzyme I (PtsP)